MNSTVKKLIYFPWVLFLFGIAAILTLLEFVFRKGRSILAFNDRAWFKSYHEEGKGP
jgi:hypothetical protein